MNLTDNKTKKFGKLERLPIPDLRADHNLVMEKIKRCSTALENGCWEWQNKRTVGGYGITMWRSRSWVVTRLILAATIGSFDQDLDACHSCNYPGCVNPSHLRVDSHRENILDASRAMRFPNQRKTHCKRGHPLSGDNLYISKQGRACKECGRICRERTKNLV